ncbi:MAG: anaerobic C4-dicarboxylate transporter [Candidatus Krumholzibacteria bacterium]|nr:anaerobic C4-dicarboxylate transporter [Candidatus Krumholzibacteria bacterium]
MIWLELVILLACIVVGARYGGIALGAVAGIGLIIFVFVLGAPPGGPPAAVLGMIIAVITALAALQAAGGLDYLVLLAQKVLRRNPQNITFLAPLTTYVLVAACGTQHVVYALLPVIAETARKAGVRPERPMSISVIAAQHGLIASPISAVTVAVLGLLAPLGVSLPKILMVIVPSTFIAVMIGALSVAWRGKSLEEEGISTDDAVDANSAGGELAELEGSALTRAKGSTLIFLLGIVFVVLLGIFEEMRPQYKMLVEGVQQYDQVDMAAAIMIIMLGVAGLIMIFFKASPEVAMKGSIMKGGMTAVISILGVAWLGSSFFEHNREFIVGGISELINQQPWVYALGLFTLSIMLFSQAATIVTLMPVAVAAGMSVGLLVGLYPAVNGLFVLPTYGTVLAAVSFDQTGTTRIGKYLLNHSFMIPGLVTTASAVILAMLIVSIVGL